MVSTTEQKGQPGAYTVRRYRQSRCVRILVHEDGRVTVTAPLRTSSAAIARTVAGHAAWIAAQRARIADAPRPVRLIARRSEADYHRYRARARIVVRDLIARIAPLLGVHVARIAIRNQRSRWGSCSRAGTVSINYKIVHLPPDLAEYLIVHELCHLRHFDHSRAFWALVATLCPDYRALRRRLLAYDGTVDMSY